MNIKNLKKLIKKGIQGSAEKQMKVFLRDKMTTEFFKKVISSSTFK